jgi:hypothetical protein
MEDKIAVQMTERGILIPYEALGELDTGDLEAILEKDQIVIRPRSVDERVRVQQVLHDAGLLYEPDWEHSVHVSQEERTRLARKLASGPSLSEAIVDEREDRA